jgi:hypothetical protein
LTSLILREYDESGTEIAMRIIGIPGHVPQTSQRISTDAVRQALERA